eukprot:Pgem_evm1s1218
MMGMQGISPENAPVKFDGENMMGMQGNSGKCTGKVRRGKGTGKIHRGKFAGENAR